MCGCDNKMIINSLKKSGGSLYAVVKSTDSGTRLPGCETWLEDFTPSHQDLEHITFIIAKFSVDQFLIYKVKMTKVSSP